MVVVDAFGDGVEASETERIGIDPNCTATSPNLLFLLSEFCISSSVSGTDIEMSKGLGPLYNVLVRCK